MNDIIRDCDDFNDRLLAYMEREDDDATRDAMERHAASCGECGSLLSELKALRADAARLPELQPSRDLWSGIAARIEAPVVPIGEHVVEVKRTVRVRRWTSRILVAAALVAAVGLGYALRGTRAEPGPIAAAPATPEFDSLANVATTMDSAVPAAVVAESREPSNAAPSAVTPAATPRPLEVQLAARAVASLAADYDREIGRLQLLVNQRRNQLDPTTVAIIEKNLLVIDTAIAECKKAIARDPASEFLIESLNQSLRTKVELMRTAALLPSRT